MKDRYYTRNLSEAIEQIKKEYGCKDVVVVSDVYYETDNGDYLELEFYVVF